MPTYKGKDGRWRYRFAFRNKRYSGSAPKSLNREKVAAQLEREHLERLMARRFVGDMPTVEKFAVQFLEYQQARVKPLTYEGQGYHLNVHTVPIIGKHQLDMVGSRELDELVTSWQRDGAAPRTINTRLGTVLRMFSLAVEWKILHTVPDANFLKIPHETVRFLSEAEAVELLDAAKFERPGRSGWFVEWYSMVLVGLRTGLRIGELRALTWADVDLKRGVVHVHQSQPGRRDMKASSTKGNRGRIVPLSKDARVVLEQKLAEAKKDKQWSPASLIWPGPAKWRHERGRELPRSETACTHYMQRCTERAKLKDVGWHTLRHTFASWLVMRGVPLRVVQELLGHATIKMTERYAHLAPGFAHAEAVRALDTPLELPALPSGDDDQEDADDD